MKFEQSVADLFNEFMRDFAEKNSHEFKSFALNGQDRDAGGDYVLSDAHRFTLVEFKSGFGDLKSENKKPRRLNLCEKLEFSPLMRDFHNSCHFVSWVASANSSVMLNIYRQQICNKEVFGQNCNLSHQSSNISCLESAGSFVKGFFSPTGKKSLHFLEFDHYIRWVLTETSGSESSDLILIASNPTTNDLVIVRLTSIQEAVNWMEAHMPPPPEPKIKNDPSSSYGW